MLLRELHVTYRNVTSDVASRRPMISTGADAAAIIAERIATEIVECFGVLTLDTQHRVIGFDVITRGTLDATLVHPRDVFRTAILHNAAAIIVCHNHPSGDPAPSPDDVEITKRLDRGGELLGIKLLDHVIVALDDDGKVRHASLRTRGDF